MHLWTDFLEFGRLADVVPDLRVWDCWLLFCLSLFKHFSYFSQFSSRNVYSIFLWMNAHYFGASRKRDSPPSTPALSLTCNLSLFVCLLTYSGSDIAVVVHEALMLPIRLVQAATHFKRVVAQDRKDATKSREYWMPCSPGDPAAQPMTWQEIQGDDLIEPPVSMVRLSTFASHFCESQKQSREVLFYLYFWHFVIIACLLITTLIIQSHFLKALVTVRPTVNQADLDKQVEFTEQFGQEG